MKKKYISNTLVAINIVLPNKHNMHIPFYPHSNGSSSYITDNADIQKAIESHYKFNSLFRLDPTYNDLPKDTISEEKTEVKKEEPVMVKVPDLATAKDYLANKYGISRTALRSEEKIKEFAKSYNIEFVGI